MPSRNRHNFSTSSFLPFPRGGEGPPPPRAEAELGGWWEAGRDGQDDDDDDDDDDYTKLDEGEKPRDGEGMDGNGGGRGGGAVIKSI